MRIWIDADACPAVIRDVLFRAADRRAIDTTLVANHFIPKPRSPHLRAVQVEAGFDRADDYIAEQVQPGDLVITGDIPLAARCLEHGGAAIRHNGDPFTPDNIGHQLAMRDLMADMRAANPLGAGGGGRPFSKADRSNFLNRLETMVQAAKRV